MRVTMNKNIKPWTATRWTALVTKIIPGKMTVAQASRTCC